MKKLSILSAVVSSCLLATATFAADSFFEVGKTYLFTPRFDIVMKGKVVQVTDQEVVFSNRYALKASKAAARVVNDDVKSRDIKGKAIMAYLKSNDKASLLESNELKDVPVSYSRSNMTAIKLDE
jgi:hypothetical protein